MIDLLFLGQVPFTNLYISFWVWLELVISGVFAFSLVFHHRRELPGWLLSVYVAWLIHHHKLAA